MSSSPEGLLGTGCLETSALPPTPSLVCKKDWGILFLGCPSPRCALLCPLFLPWQTWLVLNKFLFLTDLLAWMLSGGPGRLVWVASCSELGLGHHPLERRGGSVLLGIEQGKRDSWVLWRSPGQTRTLKCLGRWEALELPGGQQCRPCGAPSDPAGP